MKYKSALKREISENGNNKAKIIFFGFVLILAFAYLFLSCVKISAAESAPTTEIFATTFDKDGDGELETFISKDVESGGLKLTYIQGNGENDKVAIKFYVYDFPSNATSFMVVESEYSDSSVMADADRYSKVSKEVDGETVWEWKASGENDTKNGLTGEALFTTTEGGKINAEITYRLRKGSFGMKFFKIFFYNSNTLDTDPSSDLEVYYVIAQPIDMVEQGSTCTAKNSTICTNYVNGTSTRISRELKIFVPTTVAYKFVVVPVEYVFNATNNNNVVNNYTAIVDGSTIYGINYFNESSDGTVAPLTGSDKKEDANRSYMYSNFTLSGSDTIKRTSDFVTVDKGNYTYYLGDTVYKSNEIDYILTKVDSTGSFFYYLKDIFGNIKEIKQDVTDVKNRAIIAEVYKGNAKDEGAAGYNVEEDFTNESVQVQLKMTVETHFELGTCLNDKCTEIINLTKDNVRKVQYWRVNVQFDDGVDLDAYIAGDPATKNYGHKDYASTDGDGNQLIYNLYCGTGATGCTTTQVYDSNKVHLEDGAGYSSFVNNVLSMYVGVSGRYRFYIEDIYGNNSWGTETDRIEEEYRNPRVEVYAIDKAAPEITFQHDETDATTMLTKFDVETYKYYEALELAATNGEFIYDGRVSGTTEAVEKYIDEKIYYPINRDAGRESDDKFSDDTAIELSKVVATEYVYYYSGTKDKYSAYVGGTTNAYGLEGYDNDIDTILLNTKHNSNGLKVSGSTFKFNEINYYHYDYSESSQTLVCDQIATITGFEDYAEKNKLDCVNYYLDHGVDFVIEFVAEDSVGNVGKGSVYVNVVDTTPPGFTLHTTEIEGVTTIDESKLVRGSNIGTKCRMEIGQEIGSGKTQNIYSLLNCYNVDLNATVVETNTYNFEDNVYLSTQDDGLSFYNRINNKSHVKLLILSDQKDGDGNDVWLDLSTQTFIPNKTGYYDLKIIIYDNTIDAQGTNQLTVLVSYYVDRKIVLVAPMVTDKFYGSSDPAFDYCVYIDVDNHQEIRFSSNPYSDPTIFTEIYCTKITEDNTAEDVAVGKEKLFQKNTNSDFYGALSRLESSWYNANLSDKNMISDGVGVENNYVGLYRFILGTLSIKLNSDGTTADDDYIVKIHPTYRDNTKYSNTNNPVENDNVITKNPLEDDDSFSQSNVDFTIKQIILNVSASGGNKNYGEHDTNGGDYNDDSKNKYLNGFNAEGVAGLINDGVQYNDTANIILGVLRREIGENVGKYTVCNYRGLANNDNVLETKDGGYNNMYLDCIDATSPGVTFNDEEDNFSGYTYNKGILIVNSDYVRSRALYIQTNKKVDGKTLNVTTDARNNTYANYVINYTDGTYVINAIDLVIQAAPGQRREYNYTNTYDPNPWEIILYGLVDGQIKRVPVDEEDEEKVVSFNGYTADIIEGDYYDANPNEKDTTDGSEASKLEANFSEERTNWYLYHNGNQLTGYKTNETYNLLRNSNNNSSAGSALLKREVGKDGGWYQYYPLSSDLNVVSGSISSNQSEIAVITNGNNHCSYDASGHLVNGVNGTVPCKNYNLIYNPYYTTSEGYTIATKTASHTADAKGIYQDFVYKSNKKSCLTLDPDYPCLFVPGEDDLKQEVYMIQFEIYRREIIMEFNSAIEKITISNTEDYKIFYGKRYNFYKENYLSIGFYDAYNAQVANTTKLYPEDYLFLCYQNETTMARAEFDPTRSSSTGCTGDYRYGLTAGDSWTNIGLTFKMHEEISATDSGYYADTDYAIPGGVYYIYADIAEEQKRNYNFKYLGGALTIKSLAVDVLITSYLKEYGEKYYSEYGVGSDYAGFSEFTTACLLDGEFIKSNNNLVSFEEGVYCGTSTTDFENSEKNIYGFQITGLDTKDTIKGNFVGRPNRNRSVSLAADLNGLQDNVGTYTLNKGSITTIVNNEFIANNTCSEQVVKGDYGDCVLVAGKEIENYVIKGETRIYSFDMVTTVAEEKDVEIMHADPNVIEGKLFITPAEIKITVASSQTKMYGCAYNAFNTATNSASYDYISGYSGCEEGDGDYYDLGYKFIVNGDKDYQIATKGYDYSIVSEYSVSGIYGADEFRPPFDSDEDIKAGIKWHALNNGTLYRVPWSTYFDGETAKGVLMSTYVDAATSAQKAQGGNPKTYQQQTVGNYVLTLGNVDATDNEPLATYVNSCDANNMPNPSGTYKCKNYNIDYYGTSVYEPKDSVGNSNTNTESAAIYKNASGQFPTEISFTITKRTAYVYTKYDQKIYGEIDLYTDTNKSIVYLCGDNNMDGSVDASDLYDENVVGDNIKLENGTIINKDVYYGFCSQSQVDKNLDTDENNDVKVDYGLTRYYTKYNSLAKVPWNGIVGRNDVQTDVLAGRISREGMNGAAPTTDDIRGFYKYIYEDEDFYGTVHLIGSKASDNTDYASTFGYDNYLVNYYEDGKAVNEKGESVEDDDDENPVEFEIVLRQIKVAFVSFDKVYGESDDVKDYNILVCAPTEDFDFTNMKCVNKDPTDKHGLSDSHISKYVDDGLLDQDDFKRDFLVRFKRVLGENVSCGTDSLKSTSVTVQLSGYFFGGSEVTMEGELYTKTLNCNTTTISGKGVYETLAYIDQSTSSMIGYNYQINYQIGYVNITPRPILITPDEGQGFVYGNYYDTLIPAITFKDSLVKVDGDGLIKTYGLVNNTANQKGVCLNNINYYNNGTINGTTVGTCFYINDRIDEYDAGSNMTTSSYDASKVNFDTGLSDENVKNHVFGDIYESESSSRSALDREITEGVSSRYNRNVGVYNIVKGDDFKDQSGNYNVSFQTGITYEITAATTDLAPDSTTVVDDVSSTDQSGQYKIYGEKDKELTFTLTTKYTVNKGYYAKYSSSIVSVKSQANVTTLLADLERFNYSEESKTFVRATEGEYIYLAEGDTVTLSGFAYGENNGDIRNYGMATTGVKQLNEDDTINQGDVKESYHYDIACNNIIENLEGCADPNTRELSYGLTSRILLGYLYVESWNQQAGVYNIVSGFKVAVNEWNKNNYILNVVQNVKYTIIPRPIGLQIANVTKTYGQTTDNLSCEYVDGEMINCDVESGILISENDYLKYNFNVKSLAGTMASVTGSNSKLYSQNGGVANGLVSDANKVYGATKTAADDKNSQYLGVYVSRDEKNTSSQDCLYDGDTFGFCEDVGSYYLRFYGYLNTIDSITKNNYQTAYKPTSPSYTGEASGVENYYYNSYFGYNPNYFVVVIDNDENQTPVNPSEIFADTHTSTARTTNSGKDYDKLLKATGTLTINKKDVALYVNTTYADSGLEVYYIGQNTEAPNLPVIDNEIDLKYNLFNGIGVTANREEAVGGNNSYGNIIWGTQPNQVRTGDKLEGALAYCNKIISESDYNALRSAGIESDYTCDELIYNDDKKDVDTNLVGFVPIVRDTTKLSIVSASSTGANKAYEDKNYSVKFYPGALRIEEDDDKPVVNVNRSDVYIEANAIGEYMYECVGSQKTTTYIDCGDGISIVGKTELTKDLGDPILDWLNDVDNAATIIKGQLPLISECETNEYDCTSSAYFELNHGKAATGFPGIKAGEESTFVAPFTMEKEDYVKNAGPNSLKQMIITLVKWFGVTAYDQGEYIGGEYLQKKFDKYWYIVIEEQGTNGKFDISKVGQYKVHFYIMDNAGNVSEGNMYEVIDEKDVLQTTYKNVGTLHIVDTTKPVVGTLNLYNGPVECNESDCTKEENWVVAVDTYLPINTLLRYDADGNPKSDGGYVDLGESSLSLLSSADKYVRVTSPTGVSYVSDQDDSYTDELAGRYVKIAAGKKASALKHYSWSSSSSGIYLTVTGGSDNSYTVNSLTRYGNDESQWNHYYSKDGGVTWFLFDKPAKYSSLALDSEGTREIIIKAVDSGVKITTATATEVTYITQTYAQASRDAGGNIVKTIVKTETAKMNAYTFVDTSSHDDYIKEFNLLTPEEQAAANDERVTHLNSIGWNMSEAASNDADKAELISKLIYGIKAQREEGEDESVPASGYTYKRDTQKAYLDRTNPIISFGSNNGEKLYVYEFGCSFCTKGYEEKYAGAIDSYPLNYTTSETKRSDYDKNHSMVLSKLINGTMRDYTQISQEQIAVISENSGLGNDSYGMNGQKGAGLDIRNVYEVDRRFVIYAFDEAGNRTVIDLSNEIPDTNDSTADGYSVMENKIYEVIKQNPASYESLGDYTYTIIYSVFDKAGNESVYIARGVLYVDLIPEIEAEVEETELEEGESVNNYNLTIEQGEDIEEVVNNLVISAGSKTSLLTQTIYYNGELVVDDERYQKNIYDGFTTAQPGVYEITYNLQYMYYSKDGRSELIKAAPITVTITVEATPPIIEMNTSVDYSHLVVMIGAILASFAMCYFGLILKKKK